MAAPDNTSRREMLKQTVTGLGAASLLGLVGEPTEAAVSAHTFEKELALLRQDEVELQRMADKHTDVVIASRQSGKTATRMAVLPDEKLQPIRSEWLSRQTTLANELKRYYDELLARYAHEAKNNVVYWPHSDPHELILNDVFWQTWKGPVETVPVAFVQEDGSLPPVSGGVKTPAWLPEAPDCELLRQQLRLNDRYSLVRIYRSVWDHIAAQQESWLRPVDKFVLPDDLEHYRHPQRMVTPRRPIDVETGRGTSDQELTLLVVGSVLSLLHGLINRSRWPIGHPVRPTVFKQVKPLEVYIHQEAYLTTVFASVLNYIN
jgi:hypothetical protein